MIALNEKGFTHGTHIEDEILDGPDGLKRMLNFFNQTIAILEGTSDENVPQPTIKIDGAPALTFASKFEGFNKPFVSTKSLFNKNTKVYQSIQDIEQDDRPPELKAKLKYALELIQDKNFKIPDNEIWQGDLLWTLGDAKEIEDGLVTVQPNTLVYAAPKTSEIGQSMLNKKIGIVFHTRYKGTNLDTVSKSNDIKIEELGNIPNYAFVIDARVQNASGKLTWNKEETQVIQEIFNELKSFVPKLNDNSDYKLLCQNEDFIQFYVMTLQNHKVDQQEEINASTFVKDLHDWITKKMHKNYSDLDKLKTQKGRDKKRDTIGTISKELHSIVQKNEQLIQDIAQALSLATELKSEIMQKMEQASQFITMIQKRSGNYEKTSGEGFVISDVEDNFVKLVDRKTFSYFNRSPEVVKGFETKTRMTEENYVGEFLQCLKENDDLANNLMEIFDNKYLIKFQSTKYNFYNLDGVPINKNEIKDILSFLKKNKYEINSPPGGDPKVFGSLKLNGKILSLRISDKNAPGMTNEKGLVTIDAKKATSIQEALCGLLLNIHNTIKGTPENRDRIKGQYLLDYKDISKELAFIFPEEVYKKSFLFKTNSTTKTEDNLSDDIKYGLSDFSLNQSDRKTWFRALLNMTADSVVKKIENFKYSKGRVNLSNYTLLHENIKDPVISNYSSIVFSNPSGEGYKDSFNPADIFFVSDNLLSNKGGEILRNILKINEDDLIKKLKFSSTESKKSQFEKIEKFKNDLKGNNFFNIFDKLPKQERIKLYTELLRSGDLIGISLKQVLQRDGGVSQISNLTVSTNSSFLDPDSALRVKYDGTNNFKNWTFSKINLNIAGDGDGGCNVIMIGDIRKNGKNSVTEDIHFEPNSEATKDNNFGTKINLNTNLILEAGGYRTLDNAKFGKGTDNLKYFGLSENKPMENLNQLYKNLPKNTLLYAIKAASDVLIINNFDEIYKSTTGKSYLYLLYHFIENSKNPGRNLLYNMSRLFSLCAKYPLIKNVNGKEISENDDKVAEYLKIS